MFLIPVALVNATPIRFGRRALNSEGDLRELGEKSGIAGKELEAAENDMHDARHENLPGGPAAGIL